MQLGYEGGISLQISFAILAGATFFYFINTFIFLPKRHIPWALPPDYGERKKKKYGSDGIDLAEKNKKREEVVDERKAVEIYNAEGRETAGTPHKKNCIYCNSRHIVGCTYFLFILFF